MRLYIALAAVLMLLLTGCTSTDSPTSTAWIGGTQALQIEFIPDSPPDEILDDGQFPFAVSVQVTNNGEEDIDLNEGYVELDGINPQEYGLSDADFRIDMPELDKATKLSNGNIVPGMRDVVTFDGLNYQLDVPGSIQSTRIRAIACYDYSTYAAATICVKDDAIDVVNENDVCTISGTKQVASSGGPIQIQNVRQYSQGREGIQVSFDVYSAGQEGEFFYKEGTMCDRRSTNTDMYKVFVEVKPIINNGITPECRGFSEGTGNGGYLKLQNGQMRTLTCTFDTSSVQTDSEVQMEVELRYRYEQIISKPLIIKDVSVE